MGLASGSNTREYIARTSALVAVFTVVLTTNFVGIMSILTGEASGTTARLPGYVLLTAVIFVAVILTMEAAEADGHLVIRAAIVSGLLGFVLVVFGGEGLIFAIEQPEEVFDSQLLLYFVSAAVIATGLGYWGLRHWREFSRGPGL